MGSPRRPASVASVRSALHELGEPEREVERLAGVESRVASRLVLGLELLAPHVVATTEALRDIVAGQLDVHGAGPHVGRTAPQKKLLDLLHDRVAGPSLVAPLLR